MTEKPDMKPRWRVMYCGEEIDLSPHSTKKAALASVLDRSNWNVEPYDKKKSQNSNKDLYDRIDQLHIALWGLLIVLFNGFILMPSNPGWWILLIFPCEIIILILGSMTTA